jgi:hypothetical protein
MSISMPNLKDESEREREREKERERERERKRVVPTDWCEIADSPDRILKMRFTKL